MEYQVADKFMIGTREHLIEATNMMTAELTCNVGPTSGLADDLATQGEFLKKRFRVTVEDLQYEAAPRHKQN